MQLCMKYKFCTLKVVRRSCHTWHDEIIWNQRCYVRSKP